MSDRQIRDKIEHDSKNHPQNSSRVRSNGNSGNTDVKVGSAGEHGNTGRVLPQQNITTRQ